MGKKKLVTENKEFDKQCVWKDDGFQCQNDGHLSTGTLGEGPWYCRQHFARKMGWPQYEAATLVDMSQEAVDERVNREFVHPYALESAISVIPDSKTLDTP